MAKIRVDFPAETRRITVRLCRRLGKVKNRHKGYLVLRPRIKARKVIAFLKVQPVVDDAKFIK